MTNIATTLPPFSDQNYSSQNEQNEMTVVVSNVGYHIFSNCSAEQLFLLRTVCKKWKHQIDSDQQLWGFLLDRNLQLSLDKNLSPQNYMLCREYLEHAKEQKDKIFLQGRETSDKVYSLEVSERQAMINVYVRNQAGKLETTNTLPLSKDFKTSSRRDLNPNKFVVSRDKNCIATCDNRRIFYLNLKNEKLFIKKKAYKSYNEFLAISPNGQFVLISRDIYSLIWNVSKDTFTPLKKDAGIILQASFSFTPDNGFLTVNEKKICILWSNTGEKRLKVGENITSAIFSCDDKSIILEYDDED